MGSLLGGKGGGASWFGQQSPGFDDPRVTRGFDKAPRLTYNRAPSAEELMKRAAEQQVQWRESDLRPGAEQRALRAALPRKLEAFENRLMQAIAAAEQAHWNRATVGEQAAQTPRGFKEELVTAEEKFGAPWTEFFSVAFPDAPRQDPRRARAAWESRIDDVPEEAVLGAAAKKLVSPGRGTWKEAPRRYLAPWGHRGTACLPPKRLHGVMGHDLAMAGNFEPPVWSGSPCCSVYNHDGEGPS